MNHTPELRLPHLRGRSESAIDGWLDSVTTRIAKALGAPACSVFVGSGGGVFELRTGMPLPSPRPSYRPGEGLTGWVAQHCPSIHVRDMSHMGAVPLRERIRWRSSFDSALGAYRPQAFLAVPLHDAGEILGVLRVVGRDTPFTGREIRWVEAAAKRIAAELLKLRARPSSADAALGLYTADSKGVELIKTFSAKVLERLARSPEDMRALTSRAFEELVAELLVRDGWSVDLTLQTRDGGYDIVAIKSVDGIGVQLLVEAKRFRSDRPVGVGLIRELYTVKQRKHATKAMLATSSYVSPDAKAEFRDVIPWELELREFDDLADWLRRHGKWA